MRLGILWLMPGSLGGGETTKAAPGEADVGFLVVQSHNHRSIGGCDIACAHSIIRFGTSSCPV